MLPQHHDTHTTALGACGKNSVSSYRGAEDQTLCLWSPLSEGLEIVACGTSCDRALTHTTALLTCLPSSGIVCPPFASLPDPCSQYRLVSPRDDGGGNSCFPPYLSLKILKDIIFMSFLDTRHWILMFGFFLGVFSFVCVFVCVCVQNLMLFIMFSCVCSFFVFVCLFLHVS